MTAPMWPEGPLPVDPATLRPVEMTFHRIHGRRGRRKCTWMATDATVGGFVAALESAGWQVETVPFVGHRFVSDFGCEDSRDEERE